MGSLKQATYVRQQYPDSKVYIFYIDLRTPGTYEFFSKQVQSDPNVSVVKGKVAKVVEDPVTRQLQVEAEDILSARKTRIPVDVVVLATGMASSVDGNKPGLPIDFDSDNFALPRHTAPGVFVAGCARGPVDVATSVQDATAAAMEAIQAIHLAQPGQHA